MKTFFVDLLLGMLVLALFGLTYVLSFNRTFNSWLEGRPTWRDHSA
jgi:hypothetical protein